MIELSLDRERELPSFVRRATDAVEDDAGHVGAGESGGDDFAPFEAALTAALSSVWDSRVDAILPILDEVWGGPAQKATDPSELNFSTDRLASALERVAPLMAVAMEDSDLPAVRAILDGAMLRGGQAAKAETVLRAFARRNEVLAGMVNSSKYYTNNYFNRFVMPGIWADVERMMESGTPNTAAGYRDIQTRMTARLRTVPYWSVVANAGVSRAYHYGVVRGGMLTGFTGYRFVATIDQRTSLQCRSYNGREFWLADVADLMERIAAAQDPTEVKVIAPWISDKTFRGMTEQEIRSRGPVIPPLHGRCRSTIELLS